MRQSEWFERWRNNKNEEKDEDPHGGRCRTGKRGRVPWRWRRGLSEGRRRGSTESLAERETAPLSHGLF